jgi:hypothetical protein
MSPDEFRRLALSLPATSEGAHMGHSDFRVGNKIFASLGSPDERFATVKLTRDEQELALRRDPGAFVPARGAWGLRGYTNVVLAAAGEEAVESALRAAWRNTAPKRLIAELQRRGF